MRRGAHPDGKPTAHRFASISMYDLKYVRSNSLRSFSFIWVTLMRKKRTNQDRLEPDPVRDRDQARKLDPPNPSDLKVSHEGRRGVQEPWIGLAR
jgi:hypothetical protein